MQNFYVSSLLMLHNNGMWNFKNFNGWASVEGPCYAKFCKNCSNSCKDMAIFSIFLKMAAVLPRSTSGLDFQIPETTYPRFITGLCISLLQCELTVSDRHNSTVTVSSYGPHHQCLSCFQYFPIMSLATMQCINFKFSLFIQLLSYSCSAVFELRVQIHY